MSDCTGIGYEFSYKCLRSSCSRVMQVVCFFKTKRPPVPRGDNWTYKAAVLWEMKRTGTDVGRIGNVSEIRTVSVFTAR